MKLRKHQKDISQIARTIIAGERSPDDKVIVCDVVPGGGKTAMFMLFASILLEAKIVDQVIIVVPRKTLQKQTAKDWAKRSPLNPQGYVLAESKNELPLYVRDASPLLRTSEPPVVGLIATNGQLIHMTNDYVDEAKKRPTALFVDELHFLGGDDPNEAASWSRSVMRLADACTWVVAASGTLWRHDGEAMPLVTYGEPDAEGVRRPRRDVRYSLRDALAEQPPAIKPIYYQRHDAEVEFQVDDVTTTVVLSQADDRNMRNALTTFLRRSEVWQPIVDKCLDHLRGWREHVYPSRAIVVASRQDHAREIESYIRKKHRLDTVLAISDEDDSHDRLLAFREGRGDVLVTVAMASVGFDVPDCSHMVLLSSTRSWVQLLQTVMRVGRIDWSCTAEPSQQFGYVWAPKDRELDAFMTWMRSNMDEGLRDRDRTEREQGDDQAREPRVFLPLAGELGSVTYESLDGSLGADDAKFYEDLCASDPSLSSQPADIVVRIAKAAGRVRDGAVPATRPPSPERVVTPSERSDDLRQQSHQLANRVDATAAAEFGTTERQMAQLFGPVRGRTVAQLEDGIRWASARLKEEMVKKAAR